MKNIYFKEKDNLKSVTLCLKNIVKEDKMKPKESRMKEKLNRNRIEISETEKRTSQQRKTMKLKAGSSGKKINN